MNLKTKKVSIGSQALSQQNLCGGLGTKQVSALIKGKGGGTTDHSKLKNLDYIKSGHTGFAGIVFGTTEEWNQQRTYIPPEGMLVVYTDYQSYKEEGHTVYVPGFKIGDGNAYVVDKPFVGEADTKILQEHLKDTGVHIQPGEREFWNNKLNYEEPEGDLLRFTRS